MTSPTRRRPARAACCPTCDQLVTRRAAAHRRTCTRATAMSAGARPVLGRCA